MRSSERGSGARTRSPIRQRVFEGEAGESVEEEPPEGGRTPGPDIGVLAPYARVEPRERIGVAEETDELRAPPLQ